MATNMARMLTLAMLLGCARARVPVPHGKGCNQVLDRSTCCLFTDGRTGGDSGGQDCVPAADGVFFKTGPDAQDGPVCQPSCWVHGTCGGATDQSAAASVCPAAPAHWYDLGADRACRADSSDTTKDGRGTALRFYDVDDLAACQELCRLSPVCSGVEFGGAGRRCELWTRPAGHSVQAPGYTCLTLARRQNEIPKQEALPAGQIQQGGARIPAGGDIRFYAIGTSNAAWQTWPDQLHVMLRDLGYNVRTEDLQVAGALTQPSKSQTCKDEGTWRQLKTPRFGMIGWSSWGFAYDSKADCDTDGYRQIAGYPVSCTNAWACNPRWQGKIPELNATELAVGMRSADFVVLSNWINDAKAAQQSTARRVCYKDASISPLQSTDVTAANLLRLIRTIHAQNPNIVILVLARYPDTRQTIYPNERTLPLVRELNEAVKEKISGEPKTHFVDFSFPLGENMFQTLSKVHPNCRGDKVMATSVLEALYRHKVLSRGLALGDEATCLSSGECQSLSPACCQRSALCHLEHTGACLPYGPGTQ